MNHAPAQPPPARYARREDYESRIDHVELPVEAWTVFAELAQPASVEELVPRTRLAAAVVQTALDQLVTAELVRKSAMSWRDFTALKAAIPAPFPATGTSASIVSVKTLDVPTPPPWPEPEARLPAAPTAKPDVPKPAPPPAPAPRRSPPARVAPVSFRISSSNTDRRRPSLSLRLCRSGFTAASAPAEPPSRTTVWKLRPVLDAIGGKAGGGVAGQLLIYRVFLNIPTELMHAAGLHSLSLVKSDFTVTHPGFRAALAEAARRHADVDIDRLPEA